MPLSASKFFTRSNFGGMAQLPCVSINPTFSSVIVFAQASPPLKYPTPLNLG